MTLKEKNKELQEQNLILRCNNLRLRMDIEVLIDGKTSKAARKIIERYRRKRAQRDDAELELSN
jgi:hypothetical protein